MGTFLNPDPMRIIAKRIILTGHPIKVHKRTATVRYMFFDAGELYLMCHQAPLMSCFQMMSTISNRSSCTPSTDELDISASHWAHMATSKHISMDPSTRWIRCVCHCTSASSRSGHNCGRRPKLKRLVLTRWRSRYLPSLADDPSA